MTRIRHLLRRVGQRTQTVSGEGADRASLKQRLEKARASIAAWKARAVDAEGQLAALRRQISDGALRMKDMRAQAVLLQREVPATAMLRETFRHRVGTLAARTADQTRKAERDAHLLTVSPGYAEAVRTGMAPLAGAVHKMSLDGLSWWIPVRKPAQPQTESWIAKQRFPFHGILQTREVATGGIMLDLGANVGRTAIPRVVLGDVTRVYCAEPDPVTFACLTANVIDNNLRGLVLPDRTAIGDSDGTVTLLRSGSSSGFRVVTNQEIEGQPVVDVPCTTLDQWVARLSIDLDAVTFVKVDVEGYEGRVIRGASAVLARRHIAWQIEIKPAALRATGDDPEELYAQLQRAFTHFIDLNRRAVGPRVRAVRELRNALRYIEPDAKTDILLFSSTSEAI